jgi:hypothetical protein
MIQIEVITPFGSRTLNVEMDLEFFANVEARECAYCKNIFFVLVPAGKTDNKRFCKQSHRKNFNRRRA